MYYISEGSDEMKLHFRTNEYLLTWNLLYGSSFSEAIHTFKQKLYKNYKRQYNALAKDKDEMLVDIKNYIPDDDTLYNLVFETNIYTKLKDDTEKHRMELLKVWDQNKKKFNTEIKEILKFPLQEEYTIFVLHPIMDTVITSKKSINIAWGKRKDLKDPIMTMVNILSILIRNEIGDFEKEYKEIVDAILELALNELYTRMTGTSTYLTGDNTLVFLKRQIYPYWLMYLGCDKEDFTSYMMRDKIAFDIDKYNVDKNLRKISLFDFIEFCVHNQKRIVRINNLEII